MSQAKVEIKESKTKVKKLNKKSKLNSFSLPGMHTANIFSFIISPSFKIQYIFIVPN